MKKEHYSNFCTFKIASLVNVPRHYWRKYGSLTGIRNEWNEIKENKDTHQESGVSFPFTPPRLSELGKKN